MSKSRYHFLKINASLEAWTGTPRFFYCQAGTLTTQHCISFSVSPIIIVTYSC